MRPDAGATDSCYSGATAGRTFATASRRAVVSDAFLARLSKGKGRVVLTASRASEVSEERRSPRPRLFTYYLLEGLRGKADLDADGIITVDEIYIYVSKKVPEVTGQNQNPGEAGHGRRPAHPESRPVTGPSVPSDIASPPRERRSR